MFIYMITINIDIIIINSLFRCTSFVFICRVIYIFIDVVKITAGL